MKILTHLSLLLPLGFCWACAEDVDSTFVETEGMFADYRVVVDETKLLSIETSLRVGGDDGTFAELTGEDRLTADVNGASRELTHDQRGANRHFYEAYLEEVDDEAQVQIEFSRSDEFVSAPDSSVTIPPDFTPAFGPLVDVARVPRDTTVEVIWDNQDQDMYYEVEGDCIWTRSGVISDSGSLTLTAEEIEVKSLDEGEECVVTLTLERRNEGRVDPAFGEGGTFLALNKRTLAFLSTPSDTEETASGMGGNEG
jgi:hypothetical protein